MVRFLLVFIFTGILSSCSGHQAGSGTIIPGAGRTSEYLPLLKGKRVALVANQTSRIGSVHLVDSLLTLGIDVVKIFSPEHGFRGRMDAGMEVSSGTDARTGLPVVSLYGKHKKPLPSDLEDTDIVVFDIQDVGVRFYTYISTMQYMMEACAENDKPMLILDRPNPNGNYVDGPVLEPAYKSFVGMNPVPVVYGMTIGEYALMINGEGWLEGGEECELQVIHCLNYTHDSTFALPVPPSPNLPDLQSVRLYPSLAFFEGTNVSIGRGTPWPFRVYGSPFLESGDFYFTPESTPGAALHPKYEGDTCRGEDLRNFIPPAGVFSSLDLTWLIGAYQATSDKTVFFNAYFDKLAGTAKLREQIELGMPEKAIRQSWQPGLEKFRQTRSKYLVYE